MASIPRFCNECQSVYWSDFGNSFHVCVKKIHKDPDTFVRKQHNVPVKKKPKKEIFNHICQGCENPFKCSRKDRVYCTPDCRRLGEIKNQLKSANDKWKNPPPKKKPKYNSRQRERIIEWKRLYEDEGSWTKKFKSIRG